MILFKADMAQAVIERRKTVTRRRGKKRWNVGSWHLLYTRRPYAKGGAKPFAKVQIVSVTEEAHPGDSIESGPALDEEAQKEGFDWWVGFEWKYAEINGSPSLFEPCWRVEWDPETMEVLEAEG